MLEATDINGQSPTIQPYVFVDTTGTTTYTGVSISFGDGAGATWQIKKEWTSGTTRMMGFPNGSQEFTFIWNSRASYTYK